MTKQGIKLYNKLEILAVFFVQKSITINHISLKFKKLITRLLAFLVRGTEKGAVSSYALLKLASRPFHGLSRFIFRYTILQVFGYYLIIKNKLSKRTTNTGQKIIYLLSNRHLIHLVFIIIVTVVWTSNIFAAGNKENYGQNAAIYKMIGFQNIETFQENNTTIEDSKVYKYQGENTELTSDNYTETQKEAEYLEEQNVDPNTTVGDFALIKPELSNSELAKTGRRSPVDYLIVNGDTISSIAYKFDVSVNTILWANNLTLNSFIKPGQKLTIPPTTGVLYRVAKGDTIAKIASKYGADAKLVKEFNALGDDLKAGDLIMIPGGKIIFTTQTTKTGLATTRKPATGQREAADKIPASTGGKMFWPNGCQRVSQYYRGWLHTGIDIACPSGTPLRAADSGKIIRVQYGRTGYGYNVIIDHGNGIQTLYGHMSRIDVQVGDYVAKGERIGLEGSTGRSTGPHLHFEVRVGGSMVNPLSYIR